MTNTNTILLAESGDLEVYEGKEPAKTIPVQYIECCFNPTKYGSCCGNGIPTWKEDHNPEYYQWQSTKKLVKMAEEELYKMIDYLNIWNKNVSYPIDVSDIVTEKDGLYYFYPPVNKEDETQEKPQHILWVEVLKMIENNKAAHLMKYFTIKRR